MKDELRRWNIIMKMMSLVAKRDLNCVVFHDLRGLFRGNE